MRAFRILHHCHTANALFGLNSCMSLFVRKLGHSGATRSDSVGHLKALAVDTVAGWFCTILMILSKIAHTRGSSSCKPSAGFVQIRARFVFLLRLSVKVTLFFFHSCVHFQRLVTEFKCGVIIVLFVVERGSVERTNAKLIHVLDCPCDLSVVLSTLPRSLLKCSCNECTWLWSTDVERRGTWYFD